MSPTRQVSKRLTSFEVAGLLVPQPMLYFAAALQACLCPRGWMPSMWPCKLALSLLQMRLICENRGNALALVTPAVYRKPSISGSFCLYTCTQPCAAAWPRGGSHRVTHLCRTVKSWPVPPRPSAEARRQPDKLDTPETGKLFNDRQHHQRIYGQNHDSAMGWHPCR